MSTPAQKREHVRPPKGRVSGFVSDVLARPMTDYYMILATVTILAFFGLIMVMSSSMTWSVIDDASPWAITIRQAVMVVAGFVAMWVGLRMNPAHIQRLAPLLLVITAVLLLLVLIPGIGTGKEEVGSQSWIVLGPLRLQPSEVAKVAIAVWGSFYLAPEVGRADSRGWSSRFATFTAVAGGFLLLIVLQGDIGMAMAYLVVVALVMYFAGVNRRWIFAAAGAVVLGLLGLASQGGFRSHRFTVYFDALFGHFADTRGHAFQSYQGFLSLADGSLWGVGLGQSRAKWFYLPEAKNDFIFAIIGEELGLWGGTMVIALFAALAFFGVRTALRINNSFLSLLAATLTGGVVVQAFINIAYVIGLAPVTGIQLPMISAGGTSAIITLGSMGLLANCARHEPETVSAMQSFGKPSLDHLLRLPEPQPVTEGFLTPPARAPRVRTESRPTARTVAERTSRPSRLQDRDSRPTRNSRPTRRTK